MNNILFLTDFSLNSIHAIRYGLNIFNPEDHNYFLFNSYSYSYAGNTFSNDVNKQFKNNSQISLKAIHEMLENNYGHEGIRMELISKFGEIPGPLNSIVEEKGIDFIVMGASGNSSFNLSLFGSKTYETIHKVNIPVLSVPIEAPIKLPQEIGIASEEHLELWNESLSPVMKIASKAMANVFGIHVNIGKKEAILESSNFFDDPCELNYLNVESTDKLLGIRNAIGESGADLLVLQRKQRKLFEELFHKSLSKQILARIDIPILTINS